MMQFSSRQHVRSTGSAMSSSRRPALLCKQHVLRLPRYGPAMLVLDRPVQQLLYASTRWPTAAIVSLHFAELIEALRR